MTYKDLKYEMLTAERRLQGFTLSDDEGSTLATELVPDTVIRQYFYQAILDSSANLDAMGRGIYLYWDEEGRIVDVVTVALNKPGYPADYAPHSQLLDRFAIAHQVTPYRQGGDLLDSWAETRWVMERVAEDARAWVREKVAP